MRFHFDPRKSLRLRKNPRRGIGLEEAQEIFSRPCYLDQRLSICLNSTARSAGWANGSTPSSSKHARTKKANTTIWLRFGKRPEKNSNFMKSTRKRKPGATADSIARRAEKGEDVSRFFTNRGKMMRPIQRVNVDFSAPMLEELDETAKKLNISRQAVIKTLIRHALDQQYLSGGRGSARRP